MTLNFVQTTRNTFVQITQRTIGSEHNRGRRPSGHTELGTDTDSLPIPQEGRPRRSYADYAGVAAASFLWSLTLRTSSRESSSVGAGRAGVVGRRPVLTW